MIGSKDALRRPPEAVPEPIEMVIEYDDHDIEKNAENEQDAVVDFIDEDFSE